MLSPAFIAGFTAAEGHFLHYERKFRLVISLGANDRAICEELRRSTGVGTVTETPPRKEGYEGEVRWAVTGHRDLAVTILPIMDRDLFPSRKRRQYDTWRAAFIAYLESGKNKAWYSGPNICKAEGCEELTRARGWCRHHYFVNWEGPRRAEKLRSEKEPRSD